jgi:AcrR family transcriptional regulator
MPRPRTLSPDRLAEAAIAVLDRDGLGGLTMRTVAGELGMSTMGLYRYVTDRDDVERIVVDHVLAGLDTTPPVGGDWRHRVRVMVERLRAAVIAHPAVIPLAMAHRQSSVHSMRWAEGVLGVLTESGFDGPRRVVALRAILAYVTGAIQLEHLGPLNGSGTAAIAALPVSEFPLMSEVARGARGMPPDTEFGGGLDALLAGLSAEI